MTDHEWLRVQEMMYRVEKAIARVREHRPNRTDADELVRASMNLMGEIRFVENMRRIEESRRSDGISA